MKILYGVQGTGNGHITRARIMARALAKAGAEVDWVFSGRAPKDFFDMEPFGDYRLFKGLTFAIKNSRVRYGSTLLRSDLNALRRDVRSLDVDGYDLRSEEHTSELQSRGHLVCRLLLEKKKNISSIKYT